MSHENSSSQGTFQNPGQTPVQNPVQNEVEHQGPIWSHPYFLYVVLTLVLFLFLVGAAWLAWENGWIPSRGVG